MSNFRWNIGLGPIRFNAPIGGGKRKTERTKTGQVLSVLFVVAVVVCCCCAPAWDAITK